MSQAITTAEPKPAKAIVPFKGGALMPDSMDGIHRLAMGAWNAGVIPTAKTEQQAFILLAAGFEAGLGFTATCKNVMLVNNKPSLWGDAALALVRRSPICCGVSETIDKGVATCTCIRLLPDGAREAIVRTFSQKDAEVAGLWGKAGPWKQYPNRMLAMRARAFALRDAFPDLLMGLGVVEEQDGFEKAAESVAVVDSGTALEAPKAAPVALPEVPETDDDGAAFIASLETVKEK